jgi:plasmid stability protein
MASITVRGLDEALKTRLRVRAAHHGRSKEEEARERLRVSLSASPRGAQDLGKTISARFAKVGGVPAREPIRQPPLGRK